VRFCFRGFGRRLPFFLPASLVSFEYLSIEEQVTQNEMAEQYQDDIDFAFFVVNFHYTKADYDALTMRQKAFIFKAWEDKLVSDTTHIRNAVFNAVYNVMRRKNKPFLKLWKKASKKADETIVKDNMNIIKQAERNDGDWVLKIYKANGIKPPRKEGRSKWLITH